MFGCTFATLEARSSDGQTKVTYEHTDGLKCATDTQDQIIANTYSLLCNSFVAGLTLLILMLPLVTPEFVYIYIYISM